MTQFVTAYYSHFLSPEADLSAAVASLSRVGAELESYTIVEISDRKIVATYDRQGRPIERKRSAYGRMPKVWKWWDGVKMNQAEVA
jgi:hypothetical protein